MAERLRKIENRFKLPETFVKSLDLQKHNEFRHLSATTLNKGTKEIVLEDRHWEELTVEVADSIWQIWGNTVHELFSRITDDGAVKEQYFERTVGEHIITGIIDCYEVATKTLYDWKTCSVWKIKMKDFSDWERQGKVYAWLLRKNGIDVQKVRFVALIKDHSKSEAAKDPENYPPFPMHIFEFDVTDEVLAETEERIRAKEAEITKAESMPDDDIAPCTLEERWGSPPKYAVMKKGAARAVKLYDTKEEADERVAKEGSNFFVEERPAIDRKCENYCACCEFCHHWKATHQKGEEK